MSSDDAYLVGTITSRTPPKTKLCGSFRLALAVVGFAACVIMYATRINLSVAIVCMINQTAVDASYEALNNRSAPEQNCKKDDGIDLLIATVAPPEEKLSSQGEFEWSKDIQGQILGSFFIGYIFTQILGGMAAKWLGAKQILAWAVFISSLLTIITPEAARLSVYFLIAVRVMLGIVQGVLFPAFHTMWSHWAPPFERSILTGITYAGCQMGNVITLPLAGVLCDHGFAGGWPSVFYLIGIVGIIWFSIWMFLASDTPSSHRRISDGERAYITASLGVDPGPSESPKRRAADLEQLRVPWKSLLTSKPLWACVVGHWSADWGAYIMLTCLPSFMSDVLAFDITTLGFLASIPYIFYFIMINVGGFMADGIQARGLLSTVNTRRAMMTVALGSQAAFLMAASYCECGQEILAVGLLTAGTGLSGLQYAGFVTNYVDIASEYAGIAVGIGNTLSCIGGILAPFAMGAMTPDKTAAQWRGLFWLTFAILVTGMVFFNIFAAGETQPWAERKENEPKELATITNVSLEASDPEEKRRMIVST